MVRSPAEETVGGGHDEVQSLLSHGDGGLQEHLSWGRPRLAKAFRGGGI